MSKGISNFQIENGIKRIMNEDLDNNFVVVFPSNQMNKFINHAVMTSEKKAIANTDSSEKRVHTGGVY